MGVTISAADYARIAVTAPFIVGRVVAVILAERSPRLRPGVDRYVTRLVRKRLATYGNPEFRTDAAHYTPAA
ncbi:hypothetical protein [Gordonia asplenii]|uniref:hypothetical protein n=1 Tax=Gordonia asplenii TaxID=2725283 RepID=UPI001B7D6665|nr:hypothetical protein [Gordonia asplenii]